MSKQLFRLESRFIACAKRIQDLPKYSFTEVAFIGKSNVGKSTLLNAICNKKNLAIVSNKPGRTQQINFFAMQEKDNIKMILADLPGYGFADVPEKIRCYWERLITYYLANRDNLKLINVLIDSRRGVKENDIKVLELLNFYSKKYQILFTKTDKISKTERIQLKTEAAKVLGLQALNTDCNMITLSSKSGDGLDVLKDSILAVA